ncbi:fructosamine kinase family protein [Halioxenophilus sp. WMMB6]|uniref:fructosamine kinase family protein n=1 Tax=Halioxenophilus sp. WMMB6 TaxID=3073815 RepID=UPI00295E6BAE|nr:fructosamine kinase family protein [Halioxenophilus sp. WMMB6]
MTRSGGTWQAWLNEHWLGDFRQVSLGGSEGQTLLRIEGKQQPPLLVKSYYTPLATEQCQAEALGLLALATELEQSQKRSQLQVLTPLAVGENWLILPWITTRPASSANWQALGQGLAEIHRRPKANFGFVEDNFCGTTRQINTATSDGIEFFAEHRLTYQGRLNYDTGLLNDNDMSDLASLCQRLPELLPKQAAVLIHGDLWSGNVLFGERGPVLIDPACYHGWAEAELAMTQLFGGFDDRFYSAYEQVAGIDTSWRSRVSIYNLYHLLNHLYLFGPSYYSSVREILGRFA